MRNTSVNYSAWTVSVETSGVVGERASVTISCDYSVALFCTTHSLEMPMRIEQSIQDGFKFIQSHSSVGIAQQRQASRWQRSVHGFARSDLISVQRLYCTESLTCSALYEDCYTISMKYIIYRQLGFLASGFPVKSLC